MHIIHKILIAGLLALTVYMFWPRDNNQIPAIQQWHLAVDGSGSTKFMGLVLGESSLADAQLHFDDAGEVAVFLGKQAQHKKAPQLEVFFDDLPDNGRMILNLDAGPELLEKIIKANPRPNVLPNGTIKLAVPQKYVNDVRRLKIASVTFLPPMHIDRKSLETVYGPPESSIATEDGNLHLLYPALGLDLVRGADGVDILQLTPLSRYPELVAPLEKERLQDEASKLQ